jgi:hypothetical protein
MIIGKAAGVAVITIARNGFFPPCFLDCGYCYLVFSSLIVNRKLSGLYSDRTFNRLLLVFIVLICPIFSSFSFAIIQSHNPQNPERHVLVVIFQASSHTVAVSRPTGIRRCM